MDLTDNNFIEIEFPQDKNIVYILYYSLNGNDSKIPFYVGETSRGLGRFGDYLSANFSASTDFKVGEAIRYLQNHEFKITIRYKVSTNYKSEEKEYINKIKINSRLLNELNGYDYVSSNKEIERIRIQKFMEELLCENDENHRQDHSQIYIKGTITSQGVYSDNKDIYELYISKVDANNLPHEYGKKIPITIIISDKSYIANVHETKAGVVWVSSVLRKSSESEKVRLFDAIDEVGMKSGNKFIMKKSSDRSYTLLNKQQSS